MPVLQYMIAFCFYFWIEFFDQLDKKIFTFLNQFHHHALDYVMFGISHKYFWIPVYLILLITLYKLYKWQILKILLVVIAVLTISDQISSSLIKPTVARYRPCHNLELKNDVHTYHGKCGGIYGFVSSHASNSAALAVVVIFFLRRRVKYIYLYAIIYVALICYSRIYLGVHYPGDILGGIFVGVLVSSFILLLYQWLNNIKTAYKNPIDRN